MIYPMIRCVHLDSQCQVNYNLKETASKPLDGEERLPSPAIQSDSECFM